VHASTDQTRSGRLLLASVVQGGISGQKHLDGGGQVLGHLEHKLPFSLLARSDDDQVSKKGRIGSHFSRQTIGTSCSVTMGGSIPAKIDRSAGGRLYSMNGSTR